MASEYSLTDPAKSPALKSLFPSSLALSDNAGSSYSFASCSFFAFSTALSFASASGVRCSDSDFS